jgi:hypothetical protein
MFLQLLSCSPYRGAAYHSLSFFLNPEPDHPPDGAMDTGAFAAGRSTPHRVDAMAGARFQRTSRTTLVLRVSLLAGLPSRGSGQNRRFGLRRRR